MGAWGFYDDENDSSCDYWYYLLEKLDSRNDKDNTTESVVNYEYERDPVNFYKIIEEYINTGDFYQESYKVGVCLHLVKTMTNVSTQQQPLFGIPGDSALPNALPNDFPESLKQTIVNIIKSDIKTVDDSGYTSIIDRTKALNQELYLFTNGSEGSNGEGKIIQNSFANFFSRLSENVEN